MAGLPDTGIEGLNPTRRYSRMRLRQAVRGYVNLFPYSNGIIISLYNDTKAAYHLIVRTWAFEILSASLVTRGFSYQKGSIGTHTGTEQPYVPGTSKLPGAIYTLDSSTIYAPDYVPIGYSGMGQYIDKWQHNFPFAVLPPDWSLVFSYGNSGFNASMSMVWEAVAEEQLDFVD